jgi:hypothetical protein
MRKAFLVLASTMAFAFAACDRDANNNKQPAPAQYGGGPSSEHMQGGSSHNTFDEGSGPAPVGSAGHELPGLDPNASPKADIRHDGTGGLPGNAMESNGGSGAGQTGTKGEGTTLHNGFNDNGEKKRPEQGQKKVDLGPGD